MAVTRYTLTGDFENIVGGEFTARQIRAVLSTNLAKDEALVDLAANKIQPGSIELTLTNGAFSQSLIATDSADTNIDDDSLRYRVVFSYIDAATRQRVSWDSGYFELTANSDLSDVAGTIEAPVSWRSAFISEFEALSAAAIADAEAAGAAQVALAEAARDLAEQYRDEAHDISEIDTSDGVVEALIQDTGSDTSAALSASMDYAGAALPPHKLASGNEPRGTLAWTFDDGYSYAADYFALMDTKGIKGTLFLTQLWPDKAGTNGTWNDTYITSAQVQTIAGNGHELGTHGYNHESVVNYRATNGDAALAALYDGIADYIESSYTGPGGAPLEVLTGAYPAGSSDRRCREIMGRRHRFFRGTGGQVAADAWNPYNVPSIDVDTYSEAQLKVFVDTAAANDALLVFLTHGVSGGTPTTRAAQLTKIAAVMDYATSLGVRQTTFAEAMTERTARRSPGAFEDTSGNRFNRRLRTQRLSLIRSDTTSANAWVEFDTVNNAVYFDGDNGRQFEFRGVGLRVNGGTGMKFEVGRQEDYSGTPTIGSPNVAIPLLSADDSVIGKTISGTGIPANTYIGSYGAGTVGMVAADLVTPVNATSSPGAVTISIGWPTQPISRFFGRGEFHGGLRVVGASSGTSMDIYNLAGTQTVKFAATGITRIASGVFAINTAGGNLELRSARTRVQDTAAVNVLGFQSGQPSDASLDNGEVVNFRVVTAGAAKLHWRGKEADGTVRAINLPLTPVSLGAAATDAATTQTLANSIRSMLIGTGTCTT